MEQIELFKLYSYCCRRGSKDRHYQEIVEAIIKSRDPNFNYFFAKDVPGADVRIHGQVVIESKDPKWNYNFAKDVPGADIEKHGQVVIESKDQEYNWLFAKIAGADIERHEFVYIKRKKIEQPKQEMYPNTKKLRELVLKRKEVQKILSSSKKEKINFK